MLKTQKTVSLADIMAEEMAAKFREEEDDFEDKFWTPTSNFYTSTTSSSNGKSEVDDEDEQLRMALELSAREAEQEEKMRKQTMDPIPTPQTTTQSSGKDSTDQDYLYALQLHNTIKAQEYVEYLQQKERLVKDSLSKVSVSYDHHIPEYFQNPYEDEECYQEEGEEGEEREEGEEGEEGEEEEETTEILEIQPDQIIGFKPYHQTSKLNGRQPAKEIITKHDLLNDGLKNVAKLEQIVESGNMSNMALSRQVFNSLNLETRRSETHKTRVRGNKTDIATQDQVMDQRTRVALLQLLNAEALGELHGVINTGKEANVYHGISPADPETGVSSEYAIKIFKTTLNEFKNRADYIEGEFRFRHKLSRQNPRKLIKLWAEKEMRNLKRLHDKGIRCPEPIRLRENILVMSFLGKNGVPAPTLKDVQLSSEDWEKAYLQCIRLMRNMFHQCRLVHADLSEFNILYFKNKLWIIDVSQAIEHDHPRSLEFLRKDCLAISTFFSKKGVNCLSSRQLFDFVTDVNIETEEQEALYIQTSRASNTEQKDPNSLNEEIILNNVFQSQNTFIARTLSDVKHPVDEPSHVFYEAVTGLKTPNQEK